MSEPVAHCPFLNRSDSQCSEYFNLDRLRHAYKFCFDRYKACPRYAELLAERLMRRGATADFEPGRRHGQRSESPPAPVFVQLTVGARAA